MFVQASVLEDVNVKGPFGGTDVLTKLKLDRVASKLVEENEQHFHFQP